MMRKILVAGNWKMNASKDMVETLLGGLLEGSRDEANVDMAVFPPFPYLAQFHRLGRTNRQPGRERRPHG
jgi:triosephosphate isomerase